MRIGCKNDLKMRTRIPPIFFIAFLFLIAGCATQKQIDTARNLAYLYNPSMATLHPRYQVFHESDQTSLLSVKVYPVELLFNQANKDGAYLAQLEIYYRLYEINGGRSLVDTGVYKYPIEMQHVRREFVANISLPTQLSRKYNLEVITSDRLRNKAVQAFIPIDKTSPYNFHNFEVVRFPSGQPVFNSVLDSNQVIRVQYPDDKVDSLFLSYYPVDSLIPYPPSLLIPSKTLTQDPDTSYAVPNHDSIAIRFTKEGMYHFTVDPSVREGYTVFYFGEHFPSIKTPGQMVEPLAYLASKAEINRMKRNENQKLAVDNFWINAAGDIDKARELIRIYYNRVFYANYFFASYKEGWKTDRGMIYIVYGPPDVLYKNDEEERWIYRNNKGTDNIAFTFRKVESPFTQNDFVLNRSDELDTRWGEAINSWRNGLIYSIDQSNSQ